MIRTRFAKPALVAIGLAALAMFSLATLVVLYISVQSTRTSGYSLKPATFQQTDLSAQNGSIEQSDASEAQQQAPTTLSRDVDSFAAHLSAAQTPESASGSQYRQGPQHAQPAQYGQPANYGQAGQYAAAAYDTGSAGGWTQQASPDGSAALALPANWRITGGGKGAVAIEGPDSEQLVLGFQTFVMANQAPYMAPEQALAWFARTQGIRVFGIQNRGAQRGASNQVEIMVVDSELNGRRYKSVARVTTVPIGMGNWMLQISSLAAPVEHFDADFPTMQKIYNSWGLNKGYVQNGFDTAAQIHQQTTQMAVKHAESTVGRWDGFNEQMDQNIRGVTTMENSTVGKRHEIPNGSEQQYLNNCTRQGQDCRQVPTNELVQPQ